MNSACMNRRCEESAQCLRSRRRRGSQVIIVCRRSGEGHSMAEQQICSLLFSPSPSLPSPRLGVMSFSPVDGLAVPSWLPSNGWAAAYEQDTARINSPSALHMNHSDTNQRGGGASSSSTVQNLVYFTGRSAYPPSAIYQIKALENLIWLLRIWNTNIAVSFNEVSGIFFNVCCFNGAPGTNYTVTVTAHHSLIIFQSHQIHSYSQWILIKTAICFNLQSYSF